MKSGTRFWLFAGLRNTLLLLEVTQNKSCYLGKVQLELGVSLKLTPTKLAEKLLAVDMSTVTAAMVSVFVTPVIIMALCDDEVLIPGAIPSPQQYSEFKSHPGVPRS